MSDTNSVRPREADDYSTAELAAAAIDIDRVLEQEPQLGDFGFGVHDPRSKTSEERAADLLRMDEVTRMAPTPEVKAREGRG